MAKRNVVLTETQDQLAQALVSAGRFQNVGEVLRAGLRLLEQEEARVMQIQQGLRKGLAQATAGGFAEGRGSDAVRRSFERARAKGRKNRRPRGGGEGDCYHDKRAQRHYRNVGS